MRLQMTSYIDDDANNSTIHAVFNGTKADAAKLRKDLKSAGMREIVTTAVDVPTDKPGLIQYLNKLVGHD